MRMQKRIYSSLDIGKFIFACFIPLLHIPFADNNYVWLIQQYLSRLGVPFFFVVSGFLLYQSMNKHGRLVAYVLYSKRVALMLFGWLLIYLPLLYVMMKNDVNILQNLVFKTPAFLWFLTALLVAAIPFCLIRNRMLLLFVSLLLYIWGTFYGGSYQWLSGGVESYEKLFLTTRNGIFFALPLFCIGELGAKTYDNQKNVVMYLLISFILFAGEATYVIHKAALKSDFSMYFTLPIVTYFLVAFFYKLRIDIDTLDIRKYSTAIYVIQFGIISILEKIIKMIGMDLNIGGVIVWILVINSGLVFSYVTKRLKFLSFLI